MSCDLHGSTYMLAWLSTSSGRRLGSTSQCGVKLILSFILKPSLGQGRQSIRPGMNTALPPPILPLIVLFLTHESQPSGLGSSWLARGSSNRLLLPASPYAETITGARAPGATDLTSKDASPQAASGCTQPPYAPNVAPPHGSPRPPRPSSHTRHRRNSDVFRYIPSTNLKTAEYKSLLIGCAQHAPGARAPRPYHGGPQPSSPDQGDQASAWMPIR